MTASGDDGNVPANTLDGNLHDSSDDVTVFRLEGDDLYVTNGDNPHHKPVTGNYVLGTEFEAGSVVSGGRVKAYHNGVLQTTMSKSFSGAYSKAGAYTQANCANSSPCSGGNHGEAVIRGLVVTHGRTDTAPRPRAGGVEAGRGKWRGSR